MNVVLPAIVATVVSGIGYRFGKRNVDHHFDERIAEFKDRLDRQADTIRSEQQRKLHDFTLYTSKRHAVYAEIHSLLQKVIGMYVFLMERKPESRDLSRALPRDLQQLLSDNFVPAAIIAEQMDRIMAAQGATRTAVIDKIILVGLGNRAIHLRGEANNCIAVNELYLSDPVALLCMEAAALLGTWPPEGYEPHLASLRKLVGLMRVQMRREIDGSAPVAVTSEG